MIVEIYGPPCAGKTTFACSLAARLRDRGSGVELALSHRPAEQALPSHAEGASLRPASAALRRVTRPILELVAARDHLFGASPDVITARDLLRTLPPRNFVWSIRLRQYLFRLSSSWHRAGSAGCVTIFDQAFVQAICTLMLLGQPAHFGRIASALDLIPKADLLIGLSAPREVLQARLAERYRRQSRAERLLELDAETSLESIGILEHVGELLRRRGMPVIAADSSNRDSLSKSVQWIERHADVMAQAGSGWQ